MTVLRVIGWLLIAAALVFLGRDLFDWYKAGHWAATSAGKVWYGLSPGSLNLLQAGVELHLWQPLWSAILWVLRSRGPTRFGELKRSVPGISAKMLTERLRMLEEARVIFRHYEPTIPPQVTYGLAPRGEELRGALDMLNEVALRWQTEDARAALAEAAA